MRHKGENNIMLYNMIVELYWNSDCFPQITGWLQLLCESYVDKVRYSNKLKLCRGLFLQEFLQWTLLVLVVPFEACLYMQHDRCLCMYYTI